MAPHELDAWHMRRALALAALGRGAVEPNPMVGCIIANGAETLGEGWHRRFGGPHAEIEALAVAGTRAAGATLYVTLEPCCHWGKTPPCTQAILQAGVRRVVAAMADPFPAVAGGGLAALRAAGIETAVGVLAAQARELNAPYLKLLSSGRPWVVAKWAMTLDGKIASRTGSSRWVSSDVSRAAGHRLRGRVDAIIVGRGTALADDPLLTVRPRGVRVPTRVVVDTLARLSCESQLARTAADAPVLVAAGNSAPAENVAALRRAGCEVLQLPGAERADRLDALLTELGRRRMTNVLLEGGGQLLGSFFDARAVDEVHVFLAPKVIGGAAAATPVAGMGIAEMSAALALDGPQVEQLGDDLYLHGRVRHEARE